MRTFLPTVLVVLMIAAAPAHAGLLFRQTQSLEEANGKPMRTVTEMRIEGGKARADFLEMTDNPIMKPGSYMLLVDEDTAYLVNPKDRTYSRMDLGVAQNTQKTASQIEEQSRRQGHSMSIEDLKMRKTLDEPGPTLLGLPTQHVIYEVTFSRPMGLQMGPFKRSLRTQETYEIWATHALDTKLAKAAAFRKRGGGLGPSAGSALPAQVTEALGSHGLALKTIHTSEGKMVSTMPSMLGLHKDRSKETMEISELREESLKPDLFQLPKGYAEIEMMNPNAGGMPDLSQIPGSGGPSRGPGGPSMPDLDKMNK